jgi:hypothetical protein
MGVHFLQLGKKKHAKPQVLSKKVNRGFVSVPIQLFSASKTHEYQYYESCMYLCPAEGQFYIPFEIGCSYNSGKK